MMRKTLIAAAFIALTSSGALAAGAKEPPSQGWSFEGMFGTYDRAALQRGFQVYRQLCSSCHSLELIAFRNLEQIGLTPEQVEAIAAEYEVEDGPDDEGEMFFRPARPADRYPSPFPNENAARAANGGALPPDLSMIVKWRGADSITTKFRERGADYVYSVLTGYHDEVPEAAAEEYRKNNDGAELELGDGMHFNTYFPGNQIAMAPPLYDEAVEYADGTEPTLSQHARDVTQFLTWAAQPEAEDRKRMGIKVLLFVIALTGMLYALKRQIWSDLH